MNHLHRVDNVFHKLCADRHRDIFWKRPRKLGSEAIMCSRQRRPAPSPAETAV